MRNVFTFLKEFGQNREAVGSMIPSTPKLGKALCKFISRDGRKKSVLEVGPGTGTITEQLIACLRPGDRLVLVEINDQFCKLLRESADRKWKDSLEGIDLEIHCCTMEELDDAEKFDYLVSSLPLNNFSYELVKEILKAYQHLLKPGGKLSYFEYLYARKVREFVGKMKKDQERVMTCHMLEDFIHNFQLEFDEVIMNFPPAVARHFSFQPNQEN